MKKQKTFFSPHFYVSLLHLYPFPLYAVEISSETGLRKLIFILIFSLLVSSPFAGLNNITSHYL